MQCWYYLSRMSFRDGKITLKYIIEEVSIIFIFVFYLSMFFSITDNRSSLVYILLLWTTVEEPLNITCGSKRKSSLVVFSRTHVHTSKCEDDEDCWLIVLICKSIITIYFQFDCGKFNFVFKFCDVFIQ